jgi:hypothetical protein
VHLLLLLLFNYLAAIVCKVGVAAVVAPVFQAYRDLA